MAQPGGRDAPKAQIIVWGHLAFAERAESVVLPGPGGVGRTHTRWRCASAPVMAVPKPRFNTAADLMMPLTAAEAQNQLKEYFNWATLGPKLLVVDEIDHLPFWRDEEQDMPVALRQLGSPGAGIAIETSSHCHRLWAQPIRRSHRPVRTVS